MEKYFFLQMTKVAIKDSIVSHPIKDSIVYFWLIRNKSIERTKVIYFLDGLPKS